MRNDWIKMRGGLFSSPKLIAMGRHLHAGEEFRQWLLPGGGGAVNGQLVSDHALRCVTGALLCVTWSWSRAFGTSLPNGDCGLPKIAVDDLDSIAGAPHVGRAMEAVGWAEVREDYDGVILPKFFLDHNVPLTGAEKQRAYRERKRAAKSVTKTLPRKSNETLLEGEGEGEYKEDSTSVESSALQPVVAASRVEFTLPLSTGTLWSLPGRTLDAYHATYGDRLDVRHEVQKARQWLMDNKARRPRSATGMKSFLTRWLNRASDRAQPTAPGSRAAAGEGWYNPETGMFEKPMEE